MPKAHGEPGSHRIGPGGGRDDWDRPSGGLRNLCGSPGVGDDDIDRQPDQIGRHRRQSAVVPGGEPILDHDVRAVDIAELPQCVAKNVERLRRRRGRRRQDADAEYLCRLL